MQRAAEEAAMLLVQRLMEVPHLEDLMRDTLHEIVTAERVIITIEASERVQGLRLAIIPAPGVQTLQ